jgi:hypothetical protein
VALDRGPAPTVPAPVRETTTAVVPAPAPAADVAPAPARGEAVARRGSAGRRRAAPSEPEVLVPTGEAEALLRLAALVRRERLTPAVLGAAGQPSPDLAEIRPIDVKPLEIVPLDPAESSGTQD